MRIAVVAPPVTPLAEAQLGGAQALVADLARALQARGHEVRVYCAEGSHLPGLRLRTVPVAAAVARALVMPGGPVAEPLPELRQAFERLYALVCTDGADAVSQHSFDAEAVELAERLPMPVVHTLHLPPIVPAMVAAARITSRRLVTVSHAAAAAWTANGVRCEVVPNGVPDFDAGRPEVRPEAMIAGRISPEKGTHLAVELARRAGLRPRVFGTVYDATYARAHGLRPEARLARPELWSVMAGCAVTLMPVQWEEPFGLVAAESQMAGTPVVAYRRGALAEVIEEGVGGLLVDPDDEPAFLRAVAAARVLDREAVRASARRRLSIDACAAAYERVLAAS
ncbi:MAG TPA: glycosyltransferase [Candidatus Dormibacteraeota bacterium]